MFFFITTFRHWCPKCGRTFARTLSRSLALNLRRDFLIRYHRTSQNGAMGSKEKTIPPAAAPAFWSQPVLMATMHPNMKGKKSVRCKAWSGRRMK